MLDDKYKKLHVDLNSFIKNVKAQLTEAPVLSSEDKNAYSTFESLLLRLSSESTKLACLEDNDNKETLRDKRRMEYSAAYNSLTNHCLDYYKEFPLSLWDNVKVRDDKGYCAKADFSSFKASRIYYDNSWLVMASSAGTIIKNRLSDIHINVDNHEILCEMSSYNYVIKFEANKYIHNKLELLQKSLFKNKRSGIVFALEYLCDALYENGEDVILNQSLVHTGHTFEIRDIKAMDIKQLSYLRKKNVFSLKNADIELFIDAAYYEYKLCRRKGKNILDFYTSWGRLLFEMKDVNDFKKNGKIKTAIEECDRVEQELWNREVLGICF